MKNINLKINMVITIFIALIFIIILFMDNESLNSLFINYNNNLIIDEVAVLNVEYNEVIYKNNINNNQATTNNNQTNTSSSNTSNSNVKLINKVASTDYWAWPTVKNYTITSYYSSYHKALDIYQGYGSNIYAANNGVVTSVKGGCVVGNLSCNGKGGNYIVINHNHSNYYTVYMHLKDIKVKVGDVVSRGQVIGTMGNTGNVIPVPTSSAPYLGTHLHFCLYIGEPYNGGYAINPMRLY